MPNLKPNECSEHHSAKAGKAVEVSITILVISLLLVIYEGVFVPFMFVFR